MHPGMVRNNLEVFTLILNRVPLSIKLIMKSAILKFVMLAMIASLVTACGSSRQPKRGCPSSSSNMGAERVLAGEKPEKKSKFKVKGMN